MVLIDFEITIRKSVLTSFFLEILEFESRFFPIVGFCIKSVPYKLVTVFSHKNIYFM